MVTLQSYTDACTYPGRLDVASVERHLHDYLRVLGVARNIVRIERGWKLDDHPSLARTVDEIAMDARAAWDAWDAWDARDARAAMDAMDAMDARDAWAAWDAWAARDAWDAWGAWDARQKFAVWCLLYSGTWDASWLAVAAIGAAQINKPNVLAWAEPMALAFEAGAWSLYWTDDTLYWIAKPTLRRENGRLHCADGPALICDAADLYFWRGTDVPDAWIVDRTSLTAKTAITWPNVEQRRAACEIIGWANVLRELNAKVIDTDEPDIGELVEVDLPDSGKEKFLRVRCGTGREFALPVPPNMKTALQAQAWGWGLSEKQFRKPEVRT